MRLNDRQGHFTLDARLGSINTSSLNPLLKPMALAEMDKGNINRLVYHLDATNTYARGNLDFLYENLSLKLLKKDDEKKFINEGAAHLSRGLVMIFNRYRHLRMPTNRTQSLQFNLM
jgi:hypothetical protein